MWTQERSAALFARAEKHLPGGVNSPVRSFANVGCPPIFVKEGKGSQIIDEDGNTYVDYIGSWGPLILGHQSAVVEEALRHAMQSGYSFGLPTKAEIEMAELICEAYPGVEKVRMVNSGTEAVMSALRAARAFTGREDILKFEGCYHGHSDMLLVGAGSGALTFGTPSSPGIPGDVTKHTLMCAYNDIEQVRACVRAHKGSIAAVVIEPLAANMGLVAAKPSFLQELRTLCDEEGIVLIFDEVISGFRLSYGGAAEYYGITPDMACFGKIIGGGLPVGAYGGKKEIMDLIAPAGAVYQAGTLSGNPLAMQAGIAQLKYLKEHPKIYEQLEKNGAFLAEGLRALLKEAALPYQVVQVGSLLTLFFTAHRVENYQDVKRCDTKRFGSFFRSLLHQGILISPSQFEVWFLNICHSEEELRHTLEACRNALHELPR